MPGEEAVRVVCPLPGADLTRQLSRFRLRKAELIGHQLRMIIAPERRGGIGYLSGAEYDAIMATARPYSVAHLSEIYLREKEIEEEDDQDYDEYLRECWHSRENL